MSPEPVWQDEVMKTIISTLLLSIMMAAVSHAQPHYYQADEALV